MRLDQTHQCITTTNHSEARRRELTDEVDQHVPLSSVVGGVGQQELHQPAVHRLLPLGRLHAGMQEVVAALHLWGAPNTNINTTSSSMSQRATLIPQHSQFK